MVGEVRVGVGVGVCRFVPRLGLVGGWVRWMLPGGGFMVGGGGLAWGVAGREAGGWARRWPEALARHGRPFPSVAICSQGPKLS